MLIRASVLCGFRDLVGQLGGDAERLLRDVHLEGIKPESVSEFLPYAVVVRLFERAATQLNCPSFGLQLTRYQSLDMLGPLALLAMKCETVRAAAVTITTQLHTYTPAILMDLVADGAGQSTLHYNVDFASGRAAPRPQMTEFSLAFAVRGLQLLSGNRFRPAAVLFRHHSEASGREHEALFGVRPSFGQEANALLIDDHWLDRSLAHADDRLRLAVEEYLAPLIGRGSLQVHTQVEHMMARLLPTGQCSLERIAAQLAMHPRNLQRQLEARGFRFRDMIDRCRRERARELLADPRMSLTQVAGLLGYREQSALTRACRRWFNAPPLKLRRLAVQDGLQANSAISD